MAWGALVAPLGGHSFYFLFFGCHRSVVMGLNMLGCGFAVFGLVLVVVCGEDLVLFHHSLPTTILELSAAMPTKSALL